MTAVLLASGGLDSTLLAAMLRPPVHLTVDYGQLHVRELEAARAVAKHYGAEHVAVDLRGFATVARSSLTGAGGNLGAPVVPNRNAFLISVAAALAASRGVASVLIGCNAADRATVPDCRQHFLTAAGAATTLAVGVSVQAPLLLWSKRRIGAELRTLGAPVHLTWSCYRGGTSPCDTCGACRQRREALCT